jgi:ADP-ribosylglycohydrolase
MPVPADNMEELFAKWMKRDRHATEFLLNIAYMTRLADNIVDGDSEDPPKDMAHLLYRALVMQTKNQFYLANEDELSNAMATAIMQWEHSERWKKFGDQTSRIFAFVYREGVQEILRTAARIVGGYDHAKSVMEELHEISHIASPETFTEWEQEHGHV